MATKMIDAMPRGLRFQPTPKWVRAELGGEFVVDSRDAVLVWEPGKAVPAYAFPPEDIRMELLREAPEDGADHDAPIAEAWRLEIDGQIRDHVAWRYADQDLDSLIAVEWDAMDRWFEEADEVFGHPRDPFKRIDVRSSSRHVVVRIEDEIVADTRRPSLLFETGLPVRYYMPLEDVRTELLEPSAKRTFCAYKGKASYWSVRLADELHEDVVWCYPSPLPDNSQIRGLACFFNERTYVEVDGEQVGRPQTQWSAG